MVFTKNRSLKLRGSNNINLRKKGILNLNFEKITSKRLEALFQASEPAQLSGEENISKLMWKAKKMEASQGLSGDQYFKVVV